MWVRLILDFNLAVQLQTLFLHLCQGNAAPQMTIPVRGIVGAGDALLLDVDHLGKEGSK